MSCDWGRVQNDERTDIKNINIDLEKVFLMHFYQAAQPFLIFGHGKAIHRMDLDGKNQRRLVSGVGSSILLDFHFREETVYWADRNTGFIHKVAVRGARKQVIT